MPSAVIPSQGRIYSRALEKKRYSAAVLTAKGAAFVFRALTVVRGAGCDDELDDDNDDDDNNSDGKISAAWVLS
jgi:hypothetical protein